MFEVIKHPIGRFDAYRLTNGNTGEYLEVLTDVGAGLNDLVIKNRDGDLISVIDGYKTGEEVSRTIHSGFKGCKLSPFPNRLTAGKYEFEAEEYQMFINDVGGNTNLHGLLHNRIFEIEETSANEQRAILVVKHQYLGVGQGYPFAYDIFITFTMQANNIEVSTRIINTDGINIPMGDGWHPYFKFDNINEVSMNMGAAERVSSNMENELSITHGFETIQKLDDARLDDCFEVNTMEDKFTVELSDENAKVKLNVTQDSSEGKYRYLQLYTPDSRKTIAVEPVTCPPNAFNTKQDLVVLAPGHTADMSIWIGFAPL